MNSEIESFFPDNRAKNVEEATLRQAQLIDLRVLKIVDYICKKNNINYWLDGGTLLGAVRHKGFIPWDDDVDIAMTREDYNKFLEIAPKELPDDLFMQNFSTTEFAGNTWTQIKDRKSLLVLDDKAKYHQGIYLDIFPFDSYSNNKIRSVFYERLLKKLYIFVYAINAPLKKPFFNGMNFPKNIAKIILKIIFFVFAIFNKDVIYNLNIKTRDKRIKAMLRNEKTNYGYGTDVLNWDTIFDAKSIFPLGKLKFEDTEFSVPGDYYSYLSTYFGDDYMQIPPEGKRQQHFKLIKPILSDSEVDRLNEGFVNF